MKEKQVTLTRRSPHENVTERLDFIINESVLDLGIVQWFLSTKIYGAAVVFSFPQFSHVCVITVLNIYQVHNITFGVYYSLLNDILYFVGCNLPTMIAVNTVISSEMHEGSCLLVLKTERSLTFD